MMKILRILVMCLIISSIGHSQNNNPFEIQNRLDSIITDSDTHISDSIMINPFEIVDSKPHNLKNIEHPSPIQTTDFGISKYSNIPLIIFIVSLVLVFIAVQSSRKIMPTLYTALINENQFRILQKEFSKYSLLHLSLYVIFLGNLSLLFCYLFEHHLGVSIWHLFIWLFFALSSIYVIRHLIMNLMAKIFPFGSELKLYDFNITHAHVALALLLFISNLLFAYSNTGGLFLWFGIGLWIVFGIHRALRGILAGLRFRRISMFHFFMYICAFELAPNFSLFHLAKTSFLGS